MRKIFISYSRADYIDENGVALRTSPVYTILEALKADKQIDIWIDVNAKYSGKYFTSVLAKRIQWADKVLFLSSINSNSSEWVSKEILYAYDNKKEILPVLLDNSAFNVDFALILTGIDYIEYYKNPEQRISDILDNILEDPQEQNDEIITENDSAAQTPTPDQALIKETRNSLNLNINYKGCAMSMTVLLGLLFLIGVFIPFNKDYGKEGTFANNENTIRTSEPIQLEQEDSVPFISTRPSETQVAQSTSAPPSHPSSSAKSNSSKTVPSFSDAPKHSTKKTNAENEEQPVNVTSKEALVAHNDGKQESADSVPSEHSGGLPVKPRRITETVLANSSDTYKIRFKGGELAVIGVVGDGDTDLDVFVYDSEGNLVVSDVDASDDGGPIQWRPKWTETFYIVIKNKGSVSNNYTLVTNQ